MSTYAYLARCSQEGQTGFPNIRSRTRGWGRSRPLAQAMTRKEAGTWQVCMDAWVHPCIDIIWCNHATVCLFACWLVGWFVAYVDINRCYYQYREIGTHIWWQNEQKYLSEVFLWLSLSFLILSHFLSFHKHYLTSVNSGRHMHTSQPVQRHCLTPRPKTGGGLRRESFEWISINLKEWNVRSGHPLLFGPCAYRHVIEQCLTEDLITFQTYARMWCKKWVYVARETIINN